jgi:hypothetical protein
VNAAESVAIIRSALEEYKVELQALDPRKVDVRWERVARMESILTTVEQKHGLA